MGAIMQIPPPRILITGGAGFIGAHLVTRLLDAGATVAIIDNLSTGSHANLATCHDAGLLWRNVFIHDIRDQATPNLISRWEPDIVVHLAAQARVTRSAANIIEDATTNILGTLNVLNAVRQAGAERIVLASSGGTIYGEMPEGHSVFTESSARQPLSPYGVSKSTADSYTNLYATLYGIQAITLALDNIYGTRLDSQPCADIIPATAMAMLTGHPATIRGDGRQTRDFVHVDDAVEALRLACFTPLPSSPMMVNIGSGVATPINDVVDLLEAHLPNHLPRQYVPALPYEVTRNCLDPRAAAEILGWKPSIDLPTGIARVVAELNASHSLLLQGAAA
jgi:UDP-glucose 4-epimerase